jgi:hypothetical protein
MLVGLAVGGVAVAVAAAVIVVTVLNSGTSNGPASNTSSSSPPPPASSSPAVPTSTGHTQAAAVSSLLAMMSQTHRTLQTAVLDIEDNCTNLSSSQISGDVAAIQSSASQRQSEYNHAQSITVSALPSGSTLKSQLTRALFYSLQADNNYLTWAQEEQNGCFVSSQSSAYNAANQFSTRANTAKDNFAGIWNTQIAPTYNQPAVSPGDL